MATDFNLILLLGFQKEEDTQSRARKGRMDGRDENRGQRWQGEFFDSATISLQLSQITSRFSL